MSFLPQSDNARKNDMSSSSQYYNSYPETSRFETSPGPGGVGINQAPKDYESEPAPRSTSNTYHMTQTGSLNWQLPSGWKVAYRETDGRMYYFELASGRTSWNHPLAPEMPKTANGATIIPESPATASRRPDSHQCCALFSCIVFPPLGIFALVHSVLTYRSWSKGKYGDAFDHSRQAYNFAWWGVAIFLGFVAYYFFFGDGPGWEALNIFDW